jgi:hypothetical protein
MKTSANNNDCLEWRQKPNNNNSQKSTTIKNERKQRPTQQIYVPKHLRQNNNNNNNNNEKLKPSLQDTDAAVIVNEMPTLTNDPSIIGYITTTTPTKKINLKDESVAQSNIDVLEANLNSLQLKDSNQADDNNEDDLTTLDSCVINVIKSPPKTELRKIENTENDNDDDNEPTWDQIYQTDEIIKDKIVNQIKELINEKKDNEIELKQINKIDYLKWIPNDNKQRLNIEGILISILISISILKIHLLNNRISAYN